MSKIIELVLLHKRIVFNEQTWQVNKDITWLDLQNRPWLFEYAKDFVKMGAALLYKINALAHLTTISVTTASKPQLAY